MELPGRKEPCLVPAGRAEEAAEVCSAGLCSSWLVLQPLPLPWAPDTSPGEGAALPPLAGEQIPACSVPGGGWDRADLQPFALYCPGEHENIAVPSQREGSARTGQRVPVRSVLSGGWVSCVTFAHKQWLSVKAPGKGSGLVGAREGSHEPRAQCRGWAAAVHLSRVPADGAGAILFFGNITEEQTPRAGPCLPACGFGGWSSVPCTSRGSGESVPWGPHVLACTSGSFSVL